MNVSMLEPHVLRDAACQEFVVQVRVPEGAAASHAVVLLPAIAGVNEYMAERAAHLAQAGYLVVVMDYFSRAAGKPDLSTPAAIGAAVAAVDDTQVMADIATVTSWLATRQITRERVGVLGFCIGGTYAAIAAGQADAPGCAVTYYGQLRYAEPSARKPVDPMSLAGGLGAPWLGHFGDMDRLISAAEIAGFRAELQGTQRHHEIFIYGGAPHAFDEYFRPTVFRPVASAEAWRRTLTFLDWHLRQVTPA